MIRRSAEGNPAHLLIWEVKQLCSSNFSSRLFCLLVFRNQVREGILENAAVVRNPVGESSVLPSAVCAAVRGLT